jgi:hypothetical protein
MWMRENSKLAFEWSVDNFVYNGEPELPEYVRRAEERKEKLARSSQFAKYLWNHEQYFKTFVSYTVLLFLVSYFFEIRFEYGVG